MLSKLIVEASFRKSSVKRNLTALKPRSDTAAGACVLSLVTLARSFSVAGTYASSLAERRSCRTFGR